MLDSISTRFWSKVDLTANNDICWNWTAYKNKLVYGCFGMNGKSQLANRVAYELYYGTNPSDLCVLHRCDNPSCVNPKHLYLGTKKDNSNDKVERGRLADTKGTKNGAAKITEGQAESIIKLKKDGLSNFAISKILGISNVQVGNICNGKSWTHITKINRSPSTRKNGLLFYVYKQGKFVGEWNNQKECADELNIQRTGINRCLHGEIHSTFGYTFKYNQVCLS